jgi:uncharacterized protein (TIGR00156 family)
MKNKTLLVGIIGIMLLCGSFSVNAQGFTGPGGLTGPSTIQYQTVTVNEAKNLRNEVLVVLVGNIVQQFDRNHYSFRDSTGDITVKINPQDWRNLSVGVSDRVEISGEIEVKHGQVTVDVKYIRKI